MDKEERSRAERGCWYKVVFGVCVACVGWGTLFAFQGIAVTLVGGMLLVVGALLVDTPWKER
jgi:hypothetical protein